MRVLAFLTIHETNPSILKQHHTWFGWWSRWYCVRQGIWCVKRNVVVILYVLLSYILLFLYAAFVRIEFMMTYYYYFVWYYLHRYLEEVLIAYLILYALYIYLCSRPMLGRMVSITCCCEDEKVLQQPCVVPGTSASNSFMGGQMSLSILKLYFQRISTQLLAPQTVQNY